MSIFDNIVSGTKNFMNIFGKKATEFLDISKLKIIQGEIYNELRKRYRDIGKFVYDSKKQNKDFSSEIESAIQNIDNLKHRLDDVIDEIAKLKNKCKCNDCGCINDDHSKYCSKCGKEMECQKAEEEK